MKGLVNMKIGYVRVSSKSQNEARQMTKLNEYGIPTNRIYIDKQSGKDFERPAYQNMKQNVLREGDELCITSYDRLGRNKDQIKDELKYYKEHNIKVRILNLPTTLTDEDNNSVQARINETVNNIMIELLACIAEEERASILKRQDEGIAEWKKTGNTKTGKRYGRPRKDLTKSFSKSKFIEVYNKWRADPKTYTARQAMKDLDLKPNTFYRLVADYEGRARDYDKDRKRPLKYNVFQGKEVEVTTVTE